MYDLMLAEKLLIETNEKKFLKTAKKWPPRNADAPHALDFRREIAEAFRIPSNRLNNDST